jgi:hypothetical protein
MWVSMNQQDYTFKQTPVQIHCIMFSATGDACMADTQHGWVIVLTIAMGPGVTAAGIGLQIPRSHCAWCCFLPFWISIFIPRRFSSDVMRNGQFRGEHHMATYGTFTTNGGMTPLRKHEGDVMERNGEQADIFNILRLGAKNS